MPGSVKGDRRAITRGPAYTVSGMGISQNPLNEEDFPKQPSHYLNQGHTKSTEHMIQPLKNSDQDNNSAAMIQEQQQELTLDEHITIQPAPAKQDETVGDAGV